MRTSTKGTLIAVLSNPPLTNGKRTLGCVAMAAEILGFERHTVANLFSVASHATGAIAELGALEEDGDQREMRWRLPSRRATACYSLMERHHPPALLAGTSVSRSIG
jgi:hypothetical protein